MHAAPVPPSCWFLIPILCCPCHWASAHGFLWLQNRYVQQQDIGMQPYPQNQGPPTYTGFPGQPPPYEAGPYNRPAGKAACCLFASVVVHGAYAMSRHNVNMLFKSLSAGQLAGGMAQGTPAYPGPYTGGGFKPTVPKSTAPQI